MMLKCIFLNGGVRSFNLKYCVEIFYINNRIELELLKGRNCVTVVLNSENIVNFPVVLEKIKTFLQQGE